MSEPVGFGLIYRRQRWACEACGARGLVLLHRDDSPDKQRERLELAHRAQRRRDLCLTPRIVRIDG